MIRSISLAKKLLHSTTVYPGKNYVLTRQFTSSGSGRRAEKQSEPTISTKVKDFCWMSLVKSCYLSSRLLMDILPSSLLRLRDSSCMSSKSKSGSRNMFIEYLSWTGLWKLRGYVCSKAKRLEYQYLRGCGVENVIFAGDLKLVWIRYNLYERFELATLVEQCLFKRKIIVIPWLYVTDRSPSLEFIMNCTDVSDILGFQSDVPAPTFNYVLHVDGGCVDFSLNDAISKLPFLCQVVAILKYYTLGVDTVRLGGYGCVLRSVTGTVIETCFGCVIASGNMEAELISLAEGFSLTREALACDKHAVVLVIMDCKSIVENVPLLKCLVISHYFELAIQQCQDHNLFKDVWYGHVKRIHNQPADILAGFGMRKLMVGECTNISDKVIKEADVKMFEASLNFPTLKSTTVKIWRVKDGIKSEEREVVT